MQLKKWLEKKGMTQGEFAKALNVNYHRVHYLLRPYSNINLKFAAQIVDFTGGEVDFRDLLEIGETPKK